MYHSKNLEMQMIDRLSLKSVNCKQSKLHGNFAAWYCSSLPKCDKKH